MGIRAPCRIGLGGALFPGFAGFRRVFPGYCRVPPGYCRVLPGFPFFRSCFVFSDFWGSFGKNHFSFSLGISYGALKSGRATRQMALGADLVEGLASLCAEVRTRSFMMDQV